ncbi:MAG TPA: OmpA family protein [Bryobacteraceae bacterium]|nr:OmpA family protein [Bryobacteraceae bacterium]
MPSGKPEPAPDIAALSQLRELLVGQEIEDLASIQERLANPAKRIDDVAQILPEAIKSAKTKSLRDALEPVVEKTFHSSVRKNPKELADAIYPIIGPAIRSSIAAAIRDFAETLNQIVEKSASLRSIKWRIESLMTGKPFSEILLARSLLYSVEQVFLIHRENGLLLQHAAAHGAVLKDADMISGMLTAIQDFLSDSFSQSGQDLETVDAGRFKLWLTYGTKVMLVAAVSGAAPVELKQVFRKALDEIEETLQPQIAAFKQGDVSVFEPAQPILARCLLGQSAPEKRKKARLWPYALAVAVIVLAFLGYQWRQRARWDGYFTQLKQQPGIVITGIERHGYSYVIVGLKDPSARDPNILLRSSGLDPAKARFELEPYLSLNTPFARRRAFEADRDSINSRIIRFDSNSSRLAPGEADRIDDILVVMKRVLAGRPALRITITGRADETGSADANEKLSRDRADRVHDALVAQGIDPARLAIVAAGNTQPLRPGNTEWDLAFNRSASFTVSGQ